MNLTQIKAEILTGTFNNSELQELMETVQYARAQLGKSVKRQLQPGASVSFVSNRSDNEFGHSGTSSHQEHCGPYPLGIVSCTSQHD
jgi:hypothetical protein